MKAKGKFISFLLIVDTFFVAYAYGFHNREVLIIDPKLPPVVQKEVNTEKVRATVPPADGAKKHTKSAKESKKDNGKKTKAEPSKTGSEKAYQKKHAKSAAKKKPSSD